MCDIQRMQESIESGEEFGICRITTGKDDMNAAESTMNLGDIEQDEVDYDAIARISNWAAEQRVVDLGIDPHRLRQPLLTHRSETTSNTSDTITVNQTLSAPFQPTPPSTPSTDYLIRRATINADLFNVEGDEHFTFMNLRKLHKWKSAKTNWGEASKVWETTKNIVNRRRPEIMGLYTSRSPIVLQRKCIDIECNMPRYLEKWRLLKANGIDIHVVQGEEHNVQRKIDYWEAQELDPAPLRSLKCKRCRLDKHSIDVQLDGQNWKVSHPERVCSDEVPIRLTNVPFPQPNGLFLGPEGLFVPARFDELLELSMGNANSEEAVMSNFSIFALSILNPNGGLSPVKLALSNILMANNDSEELRRVWLTGRTNKRKKLM